MWDDKYDKEEFHYGLEPNDFLVQTKNYWKSCKTALCLGSGEGRNEVFILEQGIDVVALDLSTVGLKKFSNLAKSRGLSNFKLLHTKIEDAVLDDFKFDLITAIWFYGGPSLKASLYKTIKKHLMPGGLALLEVYRPEQLKFGTGGPPKVDMMYTKKEIEKSLSFLDSIILNECERDISEGIGHNGKSAVVQYLGKKEH